MEETRNLIAGRLPAMQQDAGFHDVEDTAWQIRSGSNHEVLQLRVVVAGLSECIGIGKVENCVRQGLGTSLLINNAGFRTVGPFADAELSKQKAMVQLHIVASMCLIHAALPVMIGTGQGSIIKVASPAAFIPTPGNATYSATKAYVRVFSAAPSAELRATGVKVQVVCLGFTRTEFHDTAECRQVDVHAGIPSWLWMDADKVASASMAALASNKMLCIPGSANKVWISAAWLGLAPLLAKILLARFPQLLTSNAGL